MRGASGTPRAESSVGQRIVNGRPVLSSLAPVCLPILLALLLTGDAAADVGLILSRDSAHPGESMTAVTSSPRLPTEEIAVALVLLIGIGSTLAVLRRRALRAASSRPRESGPACRSVLDASRPRSPVTNSLSAGVVAALARSGIVTSSRDRSLGISPPAAIRSTTSRPCSRRCDVIGCFWRSIARRCPVA